MGLLDGGLLMAEVTVAAQGENILHLG